MISTRNQIPGKVKSVTSGRVVFEVIVETAIGELASIITSRSFRPCNSRRAMSFSS